MQHLHPDTWQTASETLATNGYVHIPSVLSAEICQELIALYPQADLYRSVINMARYQFGQGEYKYFSYPLPNLVEQLRTEAYPHLAKIANRWMQCLGIDQQFPATHPEMLNLCKTNGQLRPTPLILRYTEGGYNTLHQDLYGDVWFPFQMVLFLNQPQEDFTGGEFVLVEQRPRMQSVAKVFAPNQGDLMIFTTNFRPIQGTRGYYRANLRHGVSQVHTGVRHTLGIIFHDGK